MKKIFFTEIEIKDIITVYQTEPIGMGAIGVKYGVSKDAIKRLLTENNITLTQPGQKNKGGRAAAQKRYGENNKKKRSEYYSEWREKNKEQLKEYNDEWRKNNSEKLKECKRNYERKRVASDPFYRVCKYFRTAIYTVLKEHNITKSDRYFNILGYSQEELIKHLEKKFTDGITWDNYGK
jgi:hypothetical protein